MWYKSSCSWIWNKKDKRGRKLQRERKKEEEGRSDLERQKERVWRGKSGMRWNSRGQGQAISSCADSDFGHLVTVNPFSAAKKLADEESGLRWKRHWNAWWRIKVGDVWIKANVRGLIRVPASPPGSERRLCNHYREWMENQPLWGEAAERPC